MEYHKYGLTKRGKSICPDCRRKTYVLYIDNSTGDPLHSSVGKCDRADNCGHHYSPQQYFTDNHISFDNKTEYIPVPKPAPKPQPSFIDKMIFEKSLSGYEKNNFVQWLGGIVGNMPASEAIERYFVGTSKTGGTCFWQIDLSGKIRSGKIIIYGNDGHRRKDVLPPVQWVHSILKLPDFHLSQCFFGEHLLVDKSKTVAIVESEKSAVIASIYLPEMIWLACGGSEGLGAEKCAVLKGRKVVLYPDCGKFRKWSEKARELSKICAVSVSSLIENNAAEHERQSGYDIADYLVRFSLSEFNSEKQDEAQANVRQSETDKYTAYLSFEGVLFIPTPPDKETTFTVYPSVEAYNKRLETPSIIPISDVDSNGMKQVFINLKTLTI